MAEVFSTLALLEAYNKRQAENKAMKSERLSKALTGNPHGPYIMPKDMPFEPVRPGEQEKGAFPVVINGKVHTMHSKPQVPPGYRLKEKDGSTAAYKVLKWKVNEDAKGHVTYSPEKLANKPNKQHTDNYLRAFEAYKRAQDDYDYVDKKGRHIKGPQWESYNRRYTDYLNKMAAYAERIEARDERVRTAPVKKAQAAFERKQASASRKKRKAELERAFHGRITPEAYAGLSPWNPMYGEYKKLTKAQLKSIGADYSKVKKPKKKTIHLADGTTAQVIDSELGVPLGFSQMYGYRGASDTITGSDGKTSQDYAEHAFDGKHKTSKWSGDCGHITGLEYSTYFQLLKVNFRAGDVVIYYRVPSTVAAELLHFAETGQETTNTFDGTQRHVLGVRFWDLIRIRGTKHGSRYRFEYQNKVEGSGGPLGRPSSGEYNTVPALEGREFAGYDTDKLKEWVDEYFRQHGRRPSPDEYKDKIHDLHSEYNGMRRTAGYKYDKNGKLVYTNVKTGIDPASIDELDEYFDTRFNRDLANKNISRQRLQKAYNEYSDMSKDIDEENITKLLREAGVDI